MRFFIHSLIAFLMGQMTLAQGVYFSSEKVVITIDSVKVHVSGNYRLFNPTSDTVSAAIAYPVPSTGCGAPFDTLIIFDPQQTQRVIPYWKKNDSLAIFPFKFPPATHYACQIFYTQTHNKSNARYIVTTIRNQQKPLEKARFELIVHNECLMEQFSFEPMSERRYGDCTIFEWEFTGFYPDKEMDFNFKITNRK